MRGFRVYIGGGTSTMTTAATVLFDFLPATEMLNVAEAVIRVFHARGDYQHKQRNRMKFLIKSMGWEAFRAAFDEALAAVRAEGGRAAEIRRRACANPKPRPTGRACPRRRLTRSPAGLTQASLTRSRHRAGAANAARS